MRRGSGTSRNIWTVEGWAYLAVLLDLYSRRHVGDCWDTEAYDAVSTYIENYYNAKRRHSAAGNQSPINFELANSNQLAA
jgi:transposase InsO family protein